MSSLALAGMVMVTNQVQMTTIKLGPPMYFEHATFDGNPLESITFAYTNPPILLITGHVQGEEEPRNFSIKEDTFPPERYVGMPSLAVRYSASILQYRIHKTRENNASFSAPCHRHWSESAIRASNGRRRIERLDGGERSPGERNHTHTCYCLH